ncbi:MAG TPA: hypothetical protein VK858_10555 [Longimicrobiales bacterium]|nr:hypothetical protein [Longimicrobiales bacterium]
MPSDAPRLDAEPAEGPDPVTEILQELAPALDAFRSAVAEAEEEVRIYRARHEEVLADPVGRITRELGTFAVGRIDPRRLAGLLGDGAMPDPLTDRLMAVAHQRFGRMATQGSGSHRVRVPTGGDLRDAVRDALAEAGRAFGLAHAVARARDHRYDPDRDHALLHAHPFDRWSPAERELAPPLVVEVDGAGLRAAGLVEFMEGRQKLVLRVRGKAPPAPLARLASPGVYVAQTMGEEAPTVVRELADHAGPGVVAVFDADAGALPFVSRPDRALEIDVDALTAAVAAATGVRGQPGLLDLRHLQALAVTPSPAAATGQGLPAGDPTVDRLAAWLLARTDLPPAGSAEA